MVPTSVALIIENVIKYFHFEKYKKCRASSFHIPFISHIMLICVFRFFINMCNTIVAIIPQNNSFCRCFTIISSVIILACFVYSVVYVRNCNFPKLFWLVFRWNQRIYMYQFIEHMHATIHRAPCTPSEK